MNEDSKRRREHAVLNVLKLFIGKKIPGEYCLQKANKNLFKKLRISNIRELSQIIKMINLKHPLTGMKVIITRPSKKTGDYTSKKTHYELIINEDQKRTTGTGDNLFMQQENVANAQTTD